MSWGTYARFQDEDGKDSFTAPILRPPGIGTWHYVDLPFDTVAEFGRKGQIRVRGKLNGVPFRSTLMPSGQGGHYMVVGAELREQAGQAFHRLFYSHQKEHNRHVAEAKRPDTRAKRVSETLRRLLGEQE